MGRANMMTATGIALVVGVSGQALAQGKRAPTYSTSQSYSTYSPPAESLDQNYGLPTYGTKGAELPQQKSRMLDPKTPDTADSRSRDGGSRDSAMRDYGARDSGAQTSSTTDFFSGSTEYTPSRNKKAAALEPGMETPRYTTSEGSTGSFGTGSTTSSETTTPQFGTAAMQFGTGQKQ